MTLVRVSMGWAALGGWPASIFLTPGGHFQNHPNSELQEKSSAQHNLLHA